MKLKQYLIRLGIRPQDLATEIGRTRQNVEQWIERDADIELTDIGVKITTSKIVHPPEDSKLVVHESQRNE